MLGSWTDLRVSSASTHQQTPPLLTAQVILESRHSVPWADVTSMTPHPPQQNQQSDQIEPQQDGVAKGSLMDYFENLIRKRQRYQGHQ